MQFLWLWLGVIAASLLIEFITTEFVSIWFVPGSVAGIVLALLDVSIVWQILAVTVVSFAFLIAFRPLAMKMLKKDIKTNTDALIGKKAKLIGDITEDNNGSVKFGDVVWTATSETPISAGAYVQVVSISGNKLIVKEIKQ